MLRLQTASNLAMRCAVCVYCLCMHKGSKKRAKRSNISIPVVEMVYFFGCCDDTVNLYVHVPLLLGVKSGVEELISGAQSLGGSRTATCMVMGLAHPLTLFCFLPNLICQLHGNFSQSIFFSRSF
jgi:hypothetical protein